jgi:hypothetical protein
VSTNSGWPLSEGHRETRAWLHKALYSQVKMSVSGQRSVAGIRDTLSLDHSLTVCGTHRDAPHALLDGLGISVGPRRAEAADLSCRRRFACREGCVHPKDAGLDLNATHDRPPWVVSEVGTQEGARIATQV